MGNGGFATVRACERKTSGEMLAVKVAISPKGKMAEAQLLLRREAIILQSLDHPNTLKIRGLRCQNGVYFMIMDKFDCNLGEWLQHRQINCQDMLTAAFQVATPVQYLHSMNTFHCGVKITNYFMDFKKDADDCPTIVLAYAAAQPFGISQPDRFRHCYVRHGAPELVLLELRNLERAARRLKPRFSHV